ncbi:MAG: 4-hydroxybenzoate octaprenyltransferase [Gammaproteobacteria bacterium]|nr:MAG: 4-hydroxybenzoate octaprenyltransferase [Gammaproteobacteria bacterium]
MTSGIDWRAKLSAWARLMRLDRPIGIWLLLWPTLWALWFAADGRPDPGILAVFVAGVVVMRSAGCVINDFADRRFDPHVARTRTRPLATGEATPGEALALFGLLLLVAFGLVRLLDARVLPLALVAAVLATVYPFTKRFTHLPQVVLGAAFSMSIPMAFAAQAGSVPRLAWLLFVTNLLWTVAYDTEYAMADREDDLRIGVKSTAILFGEADRAVIAALQGLTLLGLALAGRLSGRGLAYWMGLLVAAGLFFHQQYRIRHREPQAAFQAFLENHWVGAAVFAGLLLDML